MNDYDENEYENDEEIEYESTQNNAQKVSTRLLTIIQITVCAVILVTMILLRIFGGNAYTVVRNWYVQNINQTIVPNEQIDNIKHRVIELFPASSGVSSTGSSQAGASSQQTGSAASSTASQQNAVNSQSAASSRQATGSQAAPSSVMPVESQKLIG